MIDIDTVISIITLVVMVSPLVIFGARYLGVKTHQQWLVVISDVAEKVVRALDQTDLANDQKKEEALAKVSKAAAEKGIKLSAAELDDIIEAMVNMLHN